MNIRLRSGKDRPVRLGHPWIFSGAIADLDPALEPGTIVRVHGADGAFLGVGYANPRCPIAVRMLAREDTAIDASFIARRVEAAVTLRRLVVPPETDAYRLVNGEGDALPGFVVDRFADVLVLQCLTAGADRLRPLLVDALLAACAPLGILERSRGSVRSAEGLSARVGVVHGEVPANVTVREGALRFRVALMEGQKTGFFLDQRPNRALLGTLARGHTVLDAFAYSGAFAIAAASGGASRVVAVESSPRAVEIARDNVAVNGMSPSAVELVCADVSRYLRETADMFDLLVLDPPALAKRRADVARATRAYKDLHLWAFRRALPGALLMTFTCTPHIDAALFRKVVLGAATDAGRTVQLLQHLGPGPDHPVALGHPEGEYLHGLLVRAS